MAKRPPAGNVPRPVPEVSDHAADQPELFDTLPLDQADPSELLPPELRELAIRTRPDIEVPEGMRASFSSALEPAATAEEEVGSRSSDVFTRAQSFPEPPTLDLKGDQARRADVATNVFHEVSTTRITAAAAQTDATEAGTYERTEIVSYVSDASVPALEATDLFAIAPVPAEVELDPLDGPTDRSPLPQTGEVTRPRAPVRAITIETGRQAGRDTDLWSPGGISFGRYRLLRHLKAGGMGMVYQAMTRWGAGVERLVAIKRLLVPHTERERFVHMFLDEARVTIQLKHPSIVKVLEFGQVGDEHFLAMEYVHGRDLDSLMKSLRKQRRVCPVDVAIYVLQRVLAALEHAHNARDEHGRATGIVHRDVSPPNILCGFTGEVKLTDFGVAKATGKFTVTVPGEIKGKLAYMSPEQLKEEAVDRRSDVFAAGIVMHELLSGEPLFLGKAEVETMYNVLEAPIPALAELRAEVPPALSRIVQTALERDHARRFASAREMSEALARVKLDQAGEPPDKRLATLLDDLYAGEPAGRPLS